MESIRCSMNYENCSLICQHISPKPLDDEQAWISRVVMPLAYMEMIFSSRPEMSFLRFFMT